MDEGSRGYQQTDGTELNGTRQSPKRNEHNNQRFRTKD